MVTPNQKSIIHIQKRERYPNNTKHGVKSQREQKKKGIKKNYKTILKQLTKWQKHTHINNYLMYNLTTFSNQKT